MKNRIELNDFSFKFASYGHYYVTYTSPATYKQWCILTDNMPLIDDTKNADNPKKKDLNFLKYLCKNN